ncbi:MAG: putative lipid II flippase FtsW [Propionibacteriaceae bacterium]
MAILSSPTVDRVKANAVTQTRPAGAVIREWLAHPLASFYLVLSSAVLLLVIGMLMVWSASSVEGQARFGDAYYFVRRQVIFLAVGIPSMWWVATRSPRTLKVLGWLAIVGSMVLLAATFVPGLGVSIKGNRNWLQLGTNLLRIQPSEFAKLAIVLWGADVFARKRKLITEPKHLLFPFIPVSALIIGLVILQGDLGTSLVLAAIVLMVLWSVGANWRIIASLLAGGALAVFGLVMTSSHRMARIGGYLNPTGDSLGVNMQPLRAIYGLASGGIFGVGLGASREKWGLLAEAHTDYVLAVIGEELGLVGTLMVLGLFLTLGYAGFRIALRGDNAFHKIAAAGITSWFMVETVLNVMVVLRLLPVLGVPLPLLSYGGSALLANMLGLGVLLALSRQEPEARRALERKAKLSRTRVSTVVQDRRS